MRKMLSNEGRLLEKVRRSEITIDDLTAELKRLGWVVIDAS